MPRAKRSINVTFERPFHITRYEEVNCNFCGTSQYRLLAKELEFEIRACAECQLVYVSPQPSAEDIPGICEGMYPDDSDGEVASRSLGLHEKFLKRIIEARKPQGGTLLDAGCGFGLLLEAMKGSNWRLVGIEPSATAAGHAHRVLPEAVIHQTTLDAAPVEEESLDCIVCVAVLDHLKDPASTLRMFSRWLAPEGLLVVMTAYQAPFARLRRWAPFLPFYFEPPHHMFDLPPGTFRRFAAGLGYEDIRLDIPPPFASPTVLRTGLIWGVKAVGRVLHALSGGQYIYPFAGSYVLHGIKGAH